MVDALARSGTCGTRAFSSFCEGLHQFKFFSAVFAAVIVSGHGLSPEWGLPVSSCWGEVLRATNPIYQWHLIAVNAPARATSSGPSKEKRPLTGLFGKRAVFKAAK